MRRALQEINRSLDIRSWFPGYTFDKRVFRLVIFVIVALALYSLFVDGLMVEQFECTSTGYSFEYEVYCSEVGEVHGDSVSWVRENFGLLVILLVMLGFGLNHLLFNKNWRSDV